ncbi:MAG: hypothetical protein KIS68_14185 [Bauldia sp.]|nr:hypothetical protein [Bauldia sp.]
MRHARLAAVFATVAVALARPAMAQPVDATAFDAQFCSEVRQYVQWTNANIDAGLANGQPLMMDPVARVDYVALDCAARAVTFRHYVDRPDSEALRDDRLAAWNAAWCGPGVWREAIGLGWHVADTITFADGARYDLIAVCG